MRNGAERSLSLGTERNKRSEKLDRDAEGSGGLLPADEDEESREEGTQPNSLRRPVLASR